MKDPNDNKTKEIPSIKNIDIKNVKELDIKDDEDFFEDKPFDPYDEYGVSRSDFAWYGNDPAIIK